MKEFAENKTFLKAMEFNQIAYFDQPLSSTCSDHNNKGMYKYIDVLPCHCRFNVNKTFQFTNKLEK